ncbi:MAG: hypothetical protein ACFB02_03375 [Mastigocoleus sp.]
MSKNHPPAYLRYFKARLLNFTRPEFWMTAIILLITGLVIKEYWTNPDLLNTFKPNQNAVVKNPSESSVLSDEDKAIAADIDNLPVLFYEYKDKQTSTVNLKKSNKAAKQNLLKSNQQIEEQRNQNNSKSILTRIPNPSFSEIKNPFLSEADNLLQLKILRGNSNQISQSNQAYYPLGGLNQQNNSGITNTNQTIVQNNIGFNPLRTQIELLQSREQQNQKENRITQLVPNNFVNSNYVNFSQNTNLLTSPTNSSINYFNNINIPSNSISQFSSNQLISKNIVNSLNSSYLTPEINQQQNFYKQRNNTNSNSFNSIGNQNIIQPSYTYNQNNPTSLGITQQNTYPNGLNIRQTSTNQLAPYIPSNSSRYYNTTSPNTFNNGRNASQNKIQNIRNYNGQSIPNQYIPNLGSSYQSPQYNSSSPKVNNTNQIKINGRSYSYP